MATMRAIATWFNPRRRLIALVLAGWSAVVIVGAGDDRSGDETFALPDLSAVIAVAMSLSALLGLVVLISLRPDGKVTFGQRRQKTLRVVVVFAVAMLVLATIFDSPADNGEADAVEEEQAETTAEASTGAQERTEASTNGTDVAVLVVVALIAVALVVHTRRRATPSTRQSGGVPEESIVAGLGSVIDDVAEHLRLDADPRTAVLAAYATLERALTDRGRHREPSETPSEHLARVFVAVPALSGPAVRLGQLYELARFSDHPVTAADRDLAVTELLEARRSLDALTGDPS